MSQEYEPFGVEWEKEMMKWHKLDLINMLRQKLVEAQNASTNKPIMQCLCVKCDYRDKIQEKVDGYYDKHSICHYMKA